MPAPALSQVRIESPRLRLVPLSLDHAEAIFREFTPEVTKYMVPAPGKTVDDARAFVASSLEGLARNETLHLAIVHKETGDFLGCLGLHGLKTDHPELGLWTKASAWGNGYGLEAATALVRWARRNLEFDHLVYPVDRRNGPSRRIAEANDGTVTAEYKKTNQGGLERDEVEYWIPKTPRRTQTRRLIAAELVLSALYGVVLGLGADGRFVDTVASVVFLAVFLVWLTRDARTQGVELGTVQKVLFLLAFTAPLMFLWYGVRTRRGRSLAFFGKALVLGLLAVVAALVPGVLVAVLVSPLL